MSNRGFASDNYAGVHPDVLAKLAEVNVGHVVSYGDDPVTADAVARFRELLGEHVEVFFVFNGTGANVTALSSVLRSWENVICTQTAHINWDEAGAPERILGSKLVDVQTPDGKLTPDLIRQNFIGRGDVHHVQPMAVSITQSTELGTLYSLDELQAISDTTHELGMYLHMDGARICNAAASLGVELRETTADVGVDVLSFGGTKNGLMGGETVVVFRPEAAKFTPNIRKQQMQLASKMRFISAQFLALFENDLWRHNASHANQMARRLRDAVEDVPGVTITQKVEANGVFAILPEGAIPKLQEAYPFYVWDESTHEVRWMCSWDTTEDDIDAFAQLVREIVPASR
ncbi:MAG TPA: low specificity L-threonine aldolase [Actinomycetes bacterium]|nr:low specificity L-threonine aldolase [Actinomycetes bacterium]